MKNSPQQIAPDTSIRILQGDCRDLLKSIPSDSVNLTMTSPPYADRRKSTYGGVKPEHYVEWFLPIGAELFRVLRPDASFILNIKENVIDGQRSTYVIDLILALRKQGWRHPEEYIWHKRNPAPGKWPNRFRDGFERLLQFTKSKHFSMYQDAVRIPISEKTKSRAHRLTESNNRRHDSRTKSGIGVNSSHWIGRETVYPSNVLHLSLVGSDKKHSAVFPESIPEWFIKLFTVPGDTVLDPFCGSGTVGAVCRRMNRNFIGMEILPEYVKVARERIFPETTKFVL